MELNPGPKYPKRGLHGEMGHIMSQTVTTYGIRLRATQVMHTFVRVSPTCISIFGTCLTYKGCSLWLVSCGLFPYYRFAESVRPPDLSLLASTSLAANVGPKITYGNRVSYLMSNRGPAFRCIRSLWLLALSLSPWTS